MERDISKLRIDDSWLRHKLVLRDPPNAIAEICVTR